jgi:hypothetical protein
LRGHFFAFWIATGSLIATEAKSCPAEIFGGIAVPPHFNLDISSRAPEKVRAAQAIIDQIAALPVPSRENGAAFVGQVDALAQQLYTAIQDPAVRPAIEAYAARMIAEWQNTYPPGLGPDIWNPVKGQIRTVPQFFEHVPLHVDGSPNNVHQDFFRNLLGRSTGARYVVARNPNANNVARYQRSLVENIIFHYLALEHLERNAPLPPELRVTVLWTDPPPVPAPVSRTTP